MSLRPHHVLTGDIDDAPIVRSPEMQHPTPTRSPALQRRVTIATVTYEQYATQPQHDLTTASPTSEKTEQHVEVEDGPATTTATNIQRPPSAPAVMVHPPVPPPTVIHPVLTVPPALRTSPRPRVRLSWDVRFSPDLPSPPSMALGGGNNTVSDSTYSTRPRSNTHPVDLGRSPGPTLALNMHSRPNFGYISHAGLSGGGTPQPFTSDPVALQPATSPPRTRILIICRDLLAWLIPIYAHDLGVGCTVLDVVRGIYEALQVKVEVTGHTRSVSDGTRANRERRRVEWLRDKTVFVCLGRDEVLARRRLPGRISLWEETFVLTVARRRG